LNDEEIRSLLHSWLEGEEDAFRRVVELLTRPLIAMAYRYTRDWEWARDLTQETWIAVVEGIDGFDVRRSFRAWVHTIHRNNCLSHLRRAWVRRESLGSERSIDEAPGPPARDDPDAELERCEFHGRLLRAVLRLAESQRRVFTRVDLEDGDQREVAEDLGMKFNTLRTTLHFARKRVAELMREEEVE